MGVTGNGVALRQACVLLLLLLVLGSFPNGFATREASSSMSSSPLSSSLWIWYDVLGKGLGGIGEHSIWTDPTKFDEVIEFLSSSYVSGKVQNVLIQAQGHLGDEQSIALATEFVSRCHFEANTSVSFTFGWSKGYEEATGYSSVSDATAEALNFTDNVVKFSEELRKSLPEVPPVGLHFDVEPNPAEDAQYQQLADLLVAIDQRVTTAKLISGVAVDWSSTSSFLFASKMVNCGVASESGAKTSLMQCLARTSNLNLLMDYRNYVGNKTKPDGLFALSRDAVDAAVSSNSRLSLAVETNCDLGPYTYKISFCGKSAQELEQDLLEVRSQYQALGLWDRAFSKRTPFAIEDYKGYRALLKQ